MKHRPLVSIIIPAYNRENIIAETLESIVAQTYKHWECIVVDDGSDDGTKNKIKYYCEKDNRFSLVERQRQPKGASTCRNIGFEHSKGEMVNWFDSDDIMHPEMLEKKVTALLDQEGADFSVCRLGEFDNVFNDQNIRHLDYILYSDTPVQAYVKFKLRFYTPGPMFRKAFLDGLDKLFDEEMPRHQEGELFFRALIKSQRYAVVDETLIYRRMHESTIAGLFEQGLDSARLAVDFAYLEKIVQFSLQERLVKGDLRYFFYRQIRKYLRNGYLCNSEVSCQARKLLYKLIDEGCSGIAAAYLKLLLAIEELKLRVTNKKAAN